jgi:hypothetical protein
VGAIRGGGSDDDQLRELVGDGQGQRGWVSKEEEDAKGGRQFGA